MKKIFIKFENVCKTFSTRNQISIKDLLLLKQNKSLQTWEMKNTNFEIFNGNVIGIMGKNGMGKSTLLALINEIIKPDHGKINLTTIPSGFLELGSGFNPELTGYENIFLYGSLLGMKLSTIKNIVQKIIDFSEIEEKINLPLKIYSQGMVARLAFSILIHNPTELILLDEVLAVGDESFQKKCYSFFRDFKKKGGTVIAIYHDIKVLLSFCDLGIFIDNGNIKFFGDILETSLTYGKFLGYDKKQLGEFKKALQNKLYD